MQNECTVLFADVAGSVKLFELLGDAAARSRIASCLNTLTSITHRFGGEVIKTIGDEVMCTFPSASAGVEAAKSMQEQVSANFEQGVPTPIRIGLHHGPVICENNDVYGDTVNIAARMAGIAKADQIITTEETTLLLPENQRDDSRPFDRAPVKGKQQLVNISEILWQAEDDGTVVGFSSFATMDRTEKALTLSLGWQDQSLVISKDSAPITLGRGKQADFMITAPLASRVHSRVDEHRGKFILTDQSLNGTWVQIGENAAVFLRRESLPLTGSGLISLGEKLSAVDTPIRYTLSSG